MLRLFFVFVITLFIGFSSNAQSLNSYKYVVVPDSYDFLKGQKDRYQLNSLTQFLFKKYGFIAILDGEPYPKDLKKGSCNALFADVDNVSNMLKIKLQVILKDCNNNTVFTSVPGKSASKEFKQGYQEALRAAFVGVKKLNYFYKIPKVESVNAKGAIDASEDVVEKTILSAESGTATSVVLDTAKIATTNDVVAIRKKSVYLFNGEVYDFKKVENGYKLYKVNKDDTTVSIGSVLTTNNEDKYLVKAADLSGSGFFDSFGNFVLERVNPATDKVIRDVFAREDR